MIKGIVKESLLLMSIFTLFSAEVRGEEKMDMASGLGQPSIEWLAKTFDFGVIKEDNGAQRGSFSFVNSGQEPVLITGVRTSCGCTRAEYASESIQPGDTAVITFFYDPARRPGPFEKTIKASIATSTQKDKAGESTTDVLTIKGKVLPSQETIESDFPVDAGLGIRLSGRMVNLGDILAGASRHGFLQVMNTGEEPLYSEKVPQKAAIDGLQVSFLPQTAALEVKLMPDTIQAGELGIVSFCLDTAKETAGGERRHKVAIKLMQDGCEIVPNGEELTELQAWANIEGEMPAHKADNTDKKRFSKKYVESKNTGKSGNKKGAAGKEEKKKKGSRYGKTYTDVKKIPTEAEKAAAEANRGWKSTYTEVKKK